MRIANQLNAWLSIVLKLIAVAVIIAAVLWFGLSVYGNIVENRGTNAIPEFPGISKAAYQVALTTTGQLLFTDDYDIVAPGIYSINGYYYLSDGKWHWTKNILEIDEYYFGDIIIERR